MPQNPFEQVGRDHNGTTVLTAGAQVSLTETPAGNAIFAGWGGACSGLQSTRSFIANDALSVRDIHADVRPGDCTSSTPTCTMTIGKDSKAQATFK